MKLSSSALALAALLLGACGPTSAPAPAPDIDELLGAAGKADGDSPYVLQAHLGGSYDVRLEEHDVEISPLNARFLRFELKAGEHFVAVGRKADDSQIRPHLRLYWQKQPVAESAQQALLPMAADGDAALAFSAPSDGMVALYVADRHRNYAGTIQVDLVRMSASAPVALPEAELDARREILDLARLEPDVSQLVELGLVREVLDVDQAAALQQADGDPLRPGDLFADFQAYQALAEQGAAALADWARARNIASYATEVRRAYYVLSVELAGESGDERADAYGAYCAQLWQMMRSATYRLRAR